ncbi:hypothetical protein N7489_005958 [Penicillium chrysogenum]|uniref:uncharacterized protein n=1 Tax=Penicillium chrysogenum TaxID=5076 RepID=UPI0024DF16FE|nr:uncharacterized protein N7489_005958 [Penicillium chrysogenum]KAJ5235867.1 hypothetical protein N7489_005958 [Penicillium chrysogenum]
MEADHRNAYSTTHVTASPKGDILDEHTTSPTPGQFLAPPSRVSNQRIPEGAVKENVSGSAPSSPLDGFFSLFRLNQGKNPP